MTDEEFERFIKMVPLHATGLKLIRSQAKLPQRPVKVDPASQFEQSSD